MNFLKITLVVMYLLALNIAIPHGRAVAQTGAQLDPELLHRERQQELEESRRTWDQRHQGETVVWYVQVVNAATFERIFYTELDTIAAMGVNPKYIYNPQMWIFEPRKWVAITARNVMGLEEARRNIRGQLGFPADSDARTVGGVAQRIIWGELRGEIPATPLPQLQTLTQEQQEQVLALFHAQQQQQALIQPQPAIAAEPAQQRSVLPWLLGGVGALLLGGLLLGGF